MTIIDSPSPNWDARTLPVSMIVLHYTGMPDAAGALARLRDPAAKVSCHYLVDEDGAVHRLVDERHRAWHAGKAHWRQIDDVNSASVGIEIVNPGHDWGYRPFPDAQIAALIPLVADVKQRQAQAREAGPGEQLAGIALSGGGGIRMADDVAAGDAVALLDVGDERDQ
ncbi:MAG: N-acetylmuramoyl-L-alanine amidase, partial [Sphingomonas sp.]